MSQILVNTVCYSFILIQLLLYKNFPILTAIDKFSDFIKTNFFLPELSKSYHH